MPLWAQIILGFLTVVAVIMATQPFIHYWFGKPKIRIGFSDYKVQSGTVMICEIHNEPITKGILNFLRISRDAAQDVVAFFTMSKKDTGEMIYSSPNAVLIKTQSGVRTERVRCPASIFPSTFVIAIINPNNGEVVLEGEKELLPVGEYIIEAVVENEGKQYRRKIELIVQAQYPFAYWS